MVFYIQNEFLQERQETSFQQFLNKAILDGHMAGSMGKKNRLLEMFYRAVKGENLSVKNLKQSMECLPKAFPELRKKIQFMLPGENRKIKFAYSGKFVQGILDKLLTAKIVDVDGPRKTRNFIQLYA